MPHRPTHTAHTPKALKPSAAPLPFKEHVSTAAFDAPCNIRFTHRLRFTQNIFDAANPTLLEALAPTELGRTARFVVFLDSGVANAWPALATSIEQYAAAYSDRIELVAPAIAVPGGECIKNDRAHIDRMLQAIHDAKICRQSYVVAIGGGAVLDAVGFAASTAHRGVRLVRIPSTTLAQADSAIGVKNGINAFGKKNYLGVFAPPWAVLADTTLLSTLTDRDWRAGLSEAVKVALVKDATYFAHIASLAPQLAARDAQATVPILVRSAELHLRHITEGGDPFELTTARPLDFGHWSAHKLEQMTGYALSHGDAVAIGVALDAVYSARIGLLSAADAERILQCFDALGFTLWHTAMLRTDDLLDGLEEFREHLGGELTICMLRGLGQGIDVRAIDRGAMRTSIDALAQRAECHTLPETRQTGDAG